MWSSLWTLFSDDHTLVDLGGSLRLEPISGERPEGESLISQVSYLCVSNYAKLYFINTDFLKIVFSNGIIS